MGVPCHTLLGGPACLTKFPKLIWTIAYSMKKESFKMFKASSCNKVIILYRTMGVVLTRPFGRYGMLDKILKISLDNCLIDAKGIMHKFQPFSCNNLLNNQGFLNERGPATPPTATTEHWPCTCELSLCILTYCKRILKKYQTVAP